MFTRILIIHIEYNITLTARGHKLTNNLMHFTENVDSKDSNANQEEMPFCKFVALKREKVLMVGQLPNLK